MKRNQFYQEFIPKFLKRSAVGIVCCVLFLVAWYRLDAYLLWGFFLDPFFAVTSFLFDVHFEAGNDLGTSAFFYAWSGQGQSAEVAYKINNLNPTLAVLVLLLGCWPHKDVKSFFSLFGWCLLFTVAYHVGSVWLQVYYQTISPGFADRLGLFWEDSLRHSAMNRMVGFDKFILRYYATFPVIGLALTTRYFTRGLFEKKRR